MLYAQDEWILLAARIALLAVTLLCFALAFGSWRKAGRREMQQVLEQMQALAGSTQTLSAQVAALEKRLDDRRELAAVSVDGASRGYDLALQMARSGAALQDIVNAAGVAKNEAQLLVRLHGSGRT
jgi:outer membrane murein-binding lipoprotein Lpp